VPRRSPLPPLISRKAILSRRNLHNPLAHNG
jgi:hypothetical protein